jgi:hypothetical protein
LRCNACGGLHCPPGVGRMPLERLTGLQCPKGDGGLNAAPAPAAPPGAAALACAASGCCPTR